MSEPPDSVVLPLLEETLRVETHPVVTGKVRVTSVVDHVAEMARLTLAEETMEVTRVPVGREVSAAPATRTEGDVTIIPIMEEVMVVEKRLVLREELHVRRVRTQESVEVPITLRRQRAVVERLSEGPELRADEETAA